MTTKDIKNILDNFKENENMKSIFINGNFGIGKTYEVSKWCEKNNNVEQQIIYYSLYGVDNIEQIHTFLFNSLHPRMKKIISVYNLVSKAIALTTSISPKGINLGGNLQFLPYQPTNHKLNKSDKINKIIILDDYESLSNEKYTIEKLNNKKQLQSYYKINKSITDEFLGYLNALLIQHFKIVVIGNLNIKNDKQEINLEKLGGERVEKFFDRIYNITESNEEIIKNLLQENIKYYPFKNSSENLRIIIKSNDLFNSLLKEIPDLRHVLNLNELFDICISVIKNNMAYTTEKSFDNLLYEGIDDIKYNYVEKFYLENDVKGFKKYIDILKKKDKDSLILQSIFLVSDNNKEYQMRRQAKYIINNDIDENLLYQIFTDWFKFSNINISEQPFYNKLIKRLTNLNYNVNIDLEPYIGNYKNTSFEIFKKDLTDERNKQEIKRINKILNEKKYFDFFEYVENYWSSYNQEIKNQVKEKLKHKNYFLKPIIGDMTGTEWRLIHRVAYFISNFERTMKDEYLEELEKIKNENVTNISCIERVNIIKKQYFKTI